MERKTFQKRLANMVMALFAALLLAACGGGGPEGDHSTLASSMESSAASRASRTGAKTIDKFGNFNPSIWDDHNWYECNCSRTPDTAQPDSTPWESS